MKFFVEKLLRLLLLEDLLFKNIIIFHKRLLQKLNTVSNGVSKDVDPISTCKLCLIFSLYITYYYLFVSSTVFSNSFPDLSYFSTGDSPDDK